VRIKGIEPSLLAKPEPKSGASTNSAISAGNIFYYNTCIPESKTIRSRSPIIANSVVRSTSEFLIQNQKLPNLEFWDRKPDSTHGHLDRVSVSFGVRRCVGSIAKSAVEDIGSQILVG
jgi:hypothetical protein